MWVFVGLTPWVSILMSRFLVKFSIFLITLSEYSFNTNAIDISKKYEQ